VGAFRSHFGAIGSPGLRDNRPGLSYFVSALLAAQRPVIQAAERELKALHTRQNVLTGNLKKLTIKPPA